MSPSLCTYLAATLILVGEMENLSYLEESNHELTRETEET